MNKQNRQQALGVNSLYFPETDQAINQDIMEAPDGGAFVSLDDDLPQPVHQNEGHYDNLALTLDRGYLMTLSGQLRDAIEEDKSSRTEWENSLKDGMKQLGVVSERKDYPFDNACGNFSSAFMQAYISFLSHAIAELLPPEGPVRTSISGESMPEIDDRADRIEGWMNFYLTNTAEEYYREWKQALAWFCIQGSIFKKVYQDPIMNRPISKFVKPQDFIVNYGTTSLSTSSRITQNLRLTEKELKQRQRTGFYKDIPLFPQDRLFDSQDSVDEEQARIEGFEITSGEYNKEFRLYECHVDIVIPPQENRSIHEEESDIPHPYIVTIETESGEIIGFYRNWKENDPTYEKIQHFVDGHYVTGLGFYGFGLAHISGGNAEAATKLLRMVIDAGTLANFPGGLRAKGMAMETSNIRVGPTEFVEIDTGGLPIEQAVMMMPYKEPSEVLYQMQKDFETNILRAAGAVQQDFADFNPNAPVGTTLALLEQAHKVQSTVMRNLHETFKKEFKLIFDLFGEYLPNEPYPFKTRGKQQFIMRDDFSEDISVIPVSDPNVSSSTQRLICAETELKIAQQFPQLHNMRNVLERFYKALKVPEIDTILLPSPDQTPIQPLDPLTENQNMLVGRGAVAGITQDHQAHIVVHNLILANPQQDPQIAANAHAHIKQHEAMEMRNQIQGLLGYPLPEDMSQLPPDIQNQIATQMAQAAQYLLQQQQQAQPQIDPNQVLLEDIRVKDKANEQRHQIDQQKVDLEALRLQMDAKIEELKIQQKNNADQMKAQLEAMKMNMM